MHGSGIYTWTSGSKYDGIYNKGEKHGIGVYIYASGKIEKGSYVNGK